MQTDSTRTLIKQESSYISNLEVRKRISKHYKLIVKISLSRGLLHLYCSF